MKKILYTFLLVSLTLASCQKEQIKAEPVTASDYQTFTVTAVSPSVKTPITWQAESDRIGVFASSATSGEVLIDNAYYSAFSPTIPTLHSFTLILFTLTHTSNKNSDIKPNTRLWYESLSVSISMRF